jgi:hypothetical protein
VSLWHQLTILALVYDNVEVYGTAEKFNFFMDHPFQSAWKFKITMTELLKKND